MQVSGQQLPIYTLLEHQSRNDDQMLLRVYNYMGQHWIRLRNRDPRGKLPLILCSLLSHARPSWTGARTFAELFDPDSLRLPGAADWVPNFGLMVEDLTCRSDADIAGMRLTDFPKLVLWALRDSHSKALILDGLAVWGRPMCRILRTSDGRLLLNYFANRLEDFSWSDFHGKLLEAVPEAQEELMTFIDELLEEGRTQGRQEGREEGRIAVLTKLLSLKFGELPAQIHARLTSAGIAELDKWAERLLRATAIDEVFAD